MGNVLAGDRGRDRGRGATHHRQGRGAALGLLFGSAVALLLFSFIAGFSIGRITAALPVLISGYMVAMDRDPMVVAAWLLAAAVFYLACSWLLTPLVRVGGVFAVVLGFWAIPLPPNSTGSTNVTRVASRIAGTPLCR